MPDWKHLVADRLAHLELTPEVRREVVAEIAEHLEDCYFTLVEAGCTDPVGQTLDQVTDWNAFCRKIRRAKEDSMSVVRKVVMPGIAAMIVALAALKLSVALLVTPTPCGPDGSCIELSAFGPAYLPWLATLPVIGALSAVFARRMGARPIQRLVVALCPALYLGAEMGVFAVLDAFYWRIPIYWVLTPAAASALGALPFLGSGGGPVNARPVLTAHS